MSNMFSNCNSLKIVEISDFDTSSVIDMSHMFENCFSLVSINLSNFVFEKTENIERMFANDNSLVYVNLINADDSKIKKMNDIFLGTQENMVFCINESLSVGINKERIKKGCSIIDCSTNYTINRKLVISTTHECVLKCPEETIFFYDYMCYAKCPNKTLPEDYVCKEPEPVMPNITIKIENDSIGCSPKNFFLKKCNKNLFTERDKQRFIKQIVNDMLNSKLYELAIRAIDNKEIFIRDEGTEVYSIYSLSNKNRDPNLVNIDMDECINLLKSKLKYVNDYIIIFQMEYKIPEFKIPIVEYNLFSYFGTKKITLNHCQKTKVNLYIPKSIDNFQDYKYNPNNNYYFDKCDSYSNEDKTDLTVQDRRFEFNMNNMSLCESSCTFKSYAKNYIKCECDIKLKFNSFLNTYANRYNSIYRFEQTQKNYNNFWVLECIFNIFDKQVILSNLISQIILGIILFSIICSIIFYCKESKILYNKIKYFILYIKSNQAKIKTSNDKNKLSKFKQSNNKKGKNKILHFGKSDKKKNSIKINNLESFTERSDGKMLKVDLPKILENSNTKKDEIKENDNIEYKEYKERTYNELNNLSYNDAIIQDKRTLGQYYISYIMTKHILLFTFHCKNDFNSRIIKLVFLLYSFVIFLFMNTIFVTDSILHDIFIFKGKIGIFFYIYKIIVITFLSLIIKNILLLLIFTENNVVSIREENETDKTEKIRNVLTAVTMKCYLFFVFNLFSLIFVWVYLSCFFTIFKNTQIFVIKNTLISFGISLIIPIVLGFIPCSIRMFSLANRESQNRLCQYYLSKILHVLI